MSWRGNNEAMNEQGDIPTGTLVSRAVGDPTIAAAYDAPFPDPA